ncbi:MAG: polyprenyl synthetase family protein [Clostridia bacterium]|nr:polyprenyl synthetase family protein [Clostridia bacterium]
MDFLKELSAKQEKINNYLENAIKGEGLLQKEITEAMNYSLLAGGKRIRPVLMMATCEALGLLEDEVLPFAAALEMIHTYSLIHDDLPSMDNDDLRRGKPTNHVVFGEATAILAGDALLNFAFETALSAPFDAEKKIKAVSVMGKASGYLGMIGGQVVDLEGEKRRLSADELTKMHAMKTGALIKAATGMGCALAGRDESLLSDYSANLGLAFQLKDDILDETSTAEELGKNIGSDAKNEKTTFITLYGMKKAEELLEETTNKAIKALEKIEDSEFLEEFAMYLLKRRS